MKNYQNHFLFSETYIREYIDKNKKKNNEKLNIKYKQVKDWTEEYTIGDYKNDTWINYIDSIIDILGFNRITKLKYSLLYKNTITKEEKPIALCYKIDKLEKVSSIKKGRYYSYKAVKAGKENNVKWVILTNGFKWRLYNTENISPYENYLEIDINSSIKNNSEPDEAFKLFDFFFNVKNFHENENELVIDKIKEESNKKTELVEDFLRSKAEEILTDLSYGFKENINKELLTDEDRMNIYKDSIYLLYRMLFFGYAESRNLLPIKKNDPNYVDSFSNLCEDAKKIQNIGEVSQIKDEYEFWNRLDRHLRIYVDNNYNGGLFNNQNKPILKEYRIANRYLTKCLAEISYNKNKNNKYTDKIEYKDLTVRNLGSIYEGLLEFQLFIAEERMVIKKSRKKIKYVKAKDVRLKRSDAKNIIEPGEVYLSQDAKERKETGSYYTPEDVVEYIVENTVGKKLELLKNKLKEDLKPLYDKLLYEPANSVKRIIKSEIDEKTLEFVENNVLELNIMDSAMGSGHFLVNTVYKVSNEIVDILSDNDWESSIDVVVDVNYWKRRVVEECIYGIDINDLAVSLSRLSLWLISASKNKPLSFIDHHLKTGDSIIGTDKSHIEQKYEKSNLHMFDVSYESMMKPIINKYKEIKYIGSNTKEDVERQNQLYKEIESNIKLLKMKFDYYLASQYSGGIYNKQEYAMVMNSNDFDIFKDKKTEKLLTYARENNFFHWELEFPEVFQKGGFDIAIGNPPYVEVKKEKYLHSVMPVGNTKNLYSYIIYRNMKHLKDGGIMSLIVLMSIISSKKMLEIRKELQKVNGKISFMNIDSATYPGTLFKGLMIRLTIISVDKNEKEKNSLYSTNYKRFFQKERYKLFKEVEYQNVKKEFINDGYIPKIGSKMDESILKKIYRKTDKTFENFITKEKTENYLYYRKVGGVYYCIAFKEAPYFKKNGKQTISSSLKKIYFKKNIPPEIPLSIFHSTLFYWFWILYSDCYNFKVSDLYRFKIDMEDFKSYFDYKSTYQKINDSLELNKKFVKYKKSFGNLEYYEYRHRESKGIFDEVDQKLADYYELTNKELNYIINYDYKYRVGD